MFCLFFSFLPKYFINLKLGQNIKNHNPYGRHPNPVRRESIYFFSTFYPAWYSGAQRKEIKKDLCELSVSNERSEWAVKLFSWKQNETNSSGYEISTRKTLKFNTYYLYKSRQKYAKYQSVARLYVFSFQINLCSKHGFLLVSYK